MNKKTNFTRLLYSLMMLIMLLFASRTYAVADCSITGDSLVCENEAQTYISGYTGSYQYSWGVFGGTVVGSNLNPTVNVNWGTVGAGQVTMVVKDSVNNILCTKIMDIVVSPLPTPAIVPSLVADCTLDSSRNGSLAGKREGCIAICDSTWVTYSTALNVGSTYTWIIDGTPTYTTSVNTVNVFWESVGAGSVTVIETTIAGCIGEAILCIEVIPSPTAIFTTLPSAIGGIVSICNNQTVFFDNASIANGGSPLYSYEWIFGDGASDLLIAPTSGDVSHVYTAAGTYTAMLIITNECGCNDTAKITVVVDSSPGPDIFCISTVCPGSAVTYSTSATCSTYNWSVTNGTIVGSSTSQDVTVQWSGVSPAVIQLSVPCGAYCPSPSTLVVPVIPTMASFAGDTTLCKFECTKFHLDCAIPVDSIIWHVPAGVTVMSSLINVHEIEICATGTILDDQIWVEYFHSTNGSTVDLTCGGDLYIPLHVRPKFSLLGNSIFCENQTFSYNPWFEVATNIQWDIQNASGTSVFSALLPTGSPFSGTWIWGPGVYTVSAADVDGKYCNVSSQLIITVNESPLPPSIEGDTMICPNNTYNYVGIVTDALHTLEWTVSDGLAATGISNTHNVTWNASGTYSVTAVAVDITTGCKSTPTTLTVTSLLPLTASVILGPDTVCSNGYTDFSTTSLGTNYGWSINPSIAGSIGAGQYSDAVNVQWNNYTGNAWVVLERTLCSQSRKDSVLVFVRPSPNPSITAPSTICENATLTASTSTLAVSYNWTWGDGGTGSGTSANHIYTDPGSYVITLTVNYGGDCPIDKTAIHNINVVPAPEVNISTGDPIIYCNGTPSPTISTTMTAAYSVGTTGVTWYKAPSTVVGTGSTYTATSTGTYYAIATNAAGCTTQSNNLVISLINCSSPCKPEPYKLSFDIHRLGCNTDSFHYSQANVFDLFWDFNDAYSGSNYAAGNDPTHTYSEPGVYTTELWGKVPDASATSNDSCLVLVTKNDTINYVPDFYANINCVDYSSAYTVTFKNITKIFALAPTPSYAWSINGGGTLSTATDYTTSLSPGTYTVTLVITGVCEFTKTITIVAPTEASFTAVDSVCVGAPVQFTNTASPILGLDWTFGDGASSLLENPLRAYSTAGSFITTLTITNQYGCNDSNQQSITVLDNTLIGTLSLSGPSEFCLGDSVDITVNTTGGYGPFSYLWTTIETTPTIRARYTGNYGVDIYDSKGCFYKVPDTLILVNPIPNATIIGESTRCFGEYASLNVASPNTGHTFSYIYDGTPAPAWLIYNSYTPDAFAVGSHTLEVEVTNSFGCTAKDTFNLEIHNNPNVSITTTGSLCQGDNNILVASSTSTNLIDMFWSNGLHNDTLITAIPRLYTVTVIDSNGCKATASSLIHRLPDLCGLMTGCYEICDTVTSLQWFAPPGYTSYQWYYNGTAIGGVTTNVLDVPLHQSGKYTVVIGNASGCEVTSDDIDITFVSCSGCDIQASIKIDCGPVDVNGYQTYNITALLNNTLSSGASVSITSPGGTVTGLSPATAALGMNTFTAIFTDIPPVDGNTCFTISIWDQENRCDTVICIELPDCKSKDCGVKFEHTEPFDCVGHDGSGNPQYYGCVNVNWSGPSGATLTLVAPTSSFSPNPFTVNNGWNTICFTYTDLPSYNPGGLKIYAYFYDTIHQVVCCDSFVIKYKPCEKECKLDVVGLCAHCAKQTTTGNWVYKIQMDVTNAFGVNANVSILPIPEGTFGAITPNPITPGTSTIFAYFTDLGAIDTVICFRVVLTNPLNGRICYRDVCISLPPCDKLSVIKVDFADFVNVYPNPAKDVINVSLDGNFGSGTVKLITLDGRVVITQPIEHSVSLNLDNVVPSIYFIEVENKDGVIVRKKVIVE